LDQKWGEENKQTKGKRVDVKKVSAKKGIGKTGSGDTTNPKPKYGQGKQTLIQAKE